MTTENGKARRSLGLTPLSLRMALGDWHLARLTCSALRQSSFQKGELPTVQLNKPLHWLWSQLVNSAGFDLSRTCLP